MFSLASVAFLLDMQTDKVDGGAICDIVDRQFRRWRANPVHIRCVSGLPIADVGDINADTHILQAPQSELFKLYETQGRSVSLLMIWTLV